MAVDRGIGMTSERTRRRLLQRLKDQGIHHAATLDALAMVPRHKFVDEALASRAYEDVALPIGHGQTISQPYIVALMTQVLCADGPRKNVLEIGTGCGYQTAVLSRVVEHVYSVERIGVLHRQARDRLYTLRFRNVSLRHGDGFEGWPEHGPYDGILSAAAPIEVPPALLQQLAVGGRLVLPVGDGLDQHLRIIERTSDGYEQQQAEPVKFVPLLSGMER